jgi:hypothetical protein
LNGQTDAPNIIVVSLSIIGLHGRRGDPPAVSPQRDYGRTRWPRQLGRATVLYSVGARHTPPGRHTSEVRMPPFFGFYWTPSGERRAEEWDALRASGASDVVVPLRTVDAELLRRLGEREITANVDLGLFAGATLRDAFPGSAPIDERGEPMGVDGWYTPVCPSDERVRAKHLADLALLLERHGDLLSSVWLDFIRYPMRWEVERPRLVQTCFCDRCLGAFLGEPGRAYTREERAVATRAILAERADSWAAWKCGRIAGFVRGIADLVRARRPRLRIGLFALPWRLADHGGAIRTIVGQDIALLGQIVDLISPMVYHRLCHRPVPWIAEVVGEARERSSAPVLPVVQSLDLPEPLPDEEFAEALAVARCSSDQGVMVFDLGSVAGSAARVRAARDAFGPAPM